MHMYIGTYIHMGILDIIKYIYIYISTHVYAF